MNEVRVKVCGLTDAANARACVSAGADWIGLNFHPASPRSVTVERGAEIASALPSTAEAVGLFVDRPVAEVVAIAGRVGLSILQLHGAESPEYLSELRQSSAYPPRIVRAFRLADPAAIDRMVAYLDRAEVLGCPVHAVLVDAHVVGVPGGTGRTLPNAILDRLPFHPRLILAGGLNPENVANRVARVRPWMVDVAGGVESAPGVKDPDQVAAFVTSARGITSEFS